MPSGRLLVVDDEIEITAVIEEHFSALGYQVDVANHGAAALIQVICLALLIFCLIERQVRQALGPEQTMIGLYPDNRRVRPTGRMILYHLGELNLRIGNVTDPPTVQITRGVQLHLLELLGIQVTQTRWPQT